MAKKPVKKTTADKTVKKVAKKGASAKPLKVVKKAVTKRVISDKERDLRTANFIANSEKKKKTKRPKKTQTREQTSTLLDSIVEGMQEKKAKNITILDLTKLDNRVCDFFVICDADSRTHVGSIADSVEDTVLKLTSEKAYHTEGHENCEWVIVDYINIVAHVFLKEMRDHYNLEALWGDAEITFINN